MSRPTDSLSKSPRPRRQRLAIALAVLGVLVSAYLELLHVQTYLGIGDVSYCDAGEHVSCSNVALSGASVLLGVPLPIWGLAGFVALASAASRRSRLLLPLAGFAALSSVALLAYELLVVGAICMWCEVIHGICLALLVLAWLERGSEHPPLGARGETPHDTSLGLFDDGFVAETCSTPSTAAFRLRALAENPSARSRDGFHHGLLARKTVAIELGPAAALVAATWLFAPAYWVSASWGSSVRLPHGIDEDGRPWLGAEQPELVVHEYVDYACPHCRIASARMKMRLAADSGLRVVRHHQPRMRCGTEASTAERCSFARAAICAGEQGRFWEMDDWLFHHVPGTSKVDPERAAHDVGLDPDTLQTCMQSAATHARAQADVDEAKQWGIRGTPGYVVDGRKIKPDELRQVLDQR